jgi:hypothetical protein
MMEEAEAVMDVVQTEDAVLLQMEDHLHAALMEGHQTEDHLHAVLMADHQAAEAVLQKIEAADHLHPAMEEVTVEDLAHLQKEEVVHPAAVVDVKKVVLLTDKLLPIMPTEK